MDIWGVSSIEAEAELISILISTMKELGLNSKDVGIKINSRKIIGCIIQSLEFPEELFNEMCIIIDKMDKVSLCKIESMLVECVHNHDSDKLQPFGEDSTSTKVKQLLEILNIKELKSLEATLCKINPSNTSSIIEIIKEFEYMIDLIENCYGHGRDVRSNCDSWLEFDSKIVRGLSYYTGKGCLQMKLIDYPFCLPCLSISSLFQVSYLKHLIAPKHCVRYVAEAGMINWRIH